MQFNDYFPYFLGEGPLFGYLLLAAALLCHMPTSRCATAAAGICCGLAILTKQIGLLAVFGLCAAAVIARSTFPRRKEALLDTLRLAVLVVLPPVIFEVLKFVVLGPRGYTANLAGFLGAIADHSQSPNSRIVAFWNALGLYQVTPAVAILTGLIAVAEAWWAVRSWRRIGSSAAARLWFVLMAGAVVHFLYIGLFSDLRSRYFFVGIGLGAFALPVPLLVLSRRSAIVVFVSFLIFIASGARQSLNWPLRNVSGWMSLERARVLKLIEGDSDLPVVSQSWQTGFDIIYMLNGNHSWFYTNDEKLLPDLNGFVVLNSLFIGKQYQFYKDLPAVCDRILTCDYTRSTIAKVRTPDRLRIELERLVKIGEAAV